MKINLNCENFTEFIPKKIIIKKIIKFIIGLSSILEKSCLSDLKINSLTIDFVFCDDEFIQKINKEYRGIDKPTDVISFALFSDDSNRIITEEINLGEIIVSVDTAKRQANDNNHSLEREIYYLVCHGLLHLLGFDHQTQKDYNFMVAIQNSIMKELFND